MKIEITAHNGFQIAEIISENIEIKNSQDAVDLIANCRYQGATKMIILDSNLIPDFFDLKSGIAGEILQKFSTYDTRLAIVGDFTKYQGKSLKDFICESNKYKRINFVSSVDEAVERLTK